MQLMIDRVCVRWAMLYVYIINVSLLRVIGLYIYIKYEFKQCIYIYIYIYIKYESKEHPNLVTLIGTGLQKPLPQLRIYIYIYIYIFNLVFCRRQDINLTLFKILNTQSSFNSLLYQMFIKR